MSTIDQYEKALDNLNTATQYIESEISQIRIALSRIDSASIDKHCTDLDEVMLRCAQVLVDLSSFFYNYPNITSVLDERANSSNDRNIMLINQKLKDAFREKYFSFVALKDSVISLERLARALSSRASMFGNI